MVVDLRAGQQLPAVPRRLLRLEWSSRLTLSDFSFLPEPAVLFCLSDLSGLSDLLGLPDLPALSGLFCLSDLSDLSGWPGLLWPPPLSALASRPGALPV